MRALHVAGVAAVVLGTAPRAAGAQHCHIELPGAHAHEAHEGGAHAHHGEAPRRWWLGGSSTAVMGSGTVLGEARDYQGVTVAISGGWSRVSARVALPAYRVADEGVGLGDALLAMTGDLTPGRGAIRFGVAGSLSLPTGDGDAGRGMGHPMIAAGAWASAPLGPVRVDGVGVYARALGDGAEHAAHAHASAMWPLVDPMNPEELAFDARATAGLGARVRAGAGASYAAPISDGGETRAIAYAVAELARGRYTFSSQLAVPVAGDPFVARGTVGLAYRH
jgi:hypothetical protein